MNAFRSLPCALFVAILLQAVPSQAQQAGGGTAGSDAQVSRFAGQLMQPLNPSESRQAREEHVFQVAAGQLVEVRVDSGDFDTFLQLVPPSGDTLYNDDFESLRTSRIVTVASVGGEWRAIVSAFDQTSGQYQLAITLGSPGRTRSITGSLTEALPLSAKGHRYNRHTYVVDDVTQLFVQLSSQDFEPELILHSPSGEIVTQSFNGSSENVVTATVPSAEVGSWEIIATHPAHAGPSVGAYTIEVVETDPVVLAEDDIIRGTLGEGDPRQIHGEFYHEHTIRGSADAGITIVLEADDFDAFLAARSPSGEWFRDDDSAGDGNAQIVLPAGAGEWLVVVTSYGPDQSGSYELKTYR